MVQEDYLEHIIDRILDPYNLTTSYFGNIGKKDLPNLKCTKCGALIGTPMVYSPENRLAFRLKRGSYIKKNSDGIYPLPEDSLG